VVEAARQERQLLRASAGHHKRALASPLPVAWVTADSAYGQEGRLRRMLEEAGVGYVLAVPKSQHVHAIGRIDFAFAQAPDYAGEGHSCGAGAKGPRVYDRAAARLPAIDDFDGDEPTHDRWVPARRSLARPDEIAYYLAYAPAGTAVAELVRIAGMRWAIQEAFQRDQPRGLGRVMCWAPRQVRLGRLVDQSSGAAVTPPTLADNGGTHGPQAVTAASCFSGADGRPADCQCRPIVPTSRGTRNRFRVIQDPHDGLQIRDELLRFVAPQRLHAHDVAHQQKAGGDGDEQGSTSAGVRARQVCGEFGFVMRFDGLPHDGQSLPIRRGTKTYQKSGQVPEKQILGQERAHRLLGQHEGYVACQLQCLAEQSFF
jgi:hypothetical protein